MCGTTVPQLLRPNGIACAEPLVLLAFVGKSFYARRVGRRWVQDTPGPSTGAPPDSDSRALSNPIQEQIEPELELGRVTVPGPHDVLGRDLSKVGVRSGSRELAHNGLGHLRSLLSGVERQARLLQRETVDVAVEEGVGMSGERQ